VTWILVCSALKADPRDRQYITHIKRLGRERTGIDENEAQRRFDAKVKFRWNCRNDAFTKVVQIQVT